ncbi:LAME_0E07712g1_1 [Lachancea meyersii CBS 8951]|uniref:LAME_0E07712g1_1 n=1 Tax=Lachancea meyersii CBS 8951 TaxID=1266667 RepID=A0A1G4JIH6_9SACH|nr:LAME_0E07712g1_1 [Lachancea meyersii CBS 8951]
MWALKCRLSILRENLAVKTLKLRLWQRSYGQQRSQAKDAEKLRLVKESLQLDAYGVGCGNLKEFGKCLYPVKHSMVNFPDGQKSQVGNLQALGGSLLRLIILRSFLDVFKKSSQDVAGLDFNYEAKMNHMSSSRRLPDVLLRRFLRRRFNKLARLPMPESVVPIRTQRVLTRDVFTP